MDSIPSAAARLQGGASKLSDRRDEANASEAGPRAPMILSFSANLGIALAAVFVGYAVMLYYRAEGASLHTMLDTSVALIAALIALLLWDMSRKSETGRPIFLTITFAMLAMGEL